MTNPIDLLRRRLQRARIAYIRTFLGPDGKPLPYAATVLADLRRAAGIEKGGVVVNRVTGAVDPYATAYRAGRRDMYLRVAKYLGLDEAAIVEDDDNA